MNQFSDDRFEVALKILNRNDAYLANVNTKSTILLSFAAAVIAAIGFNYSKIAGLIHGESLPSWFGIFVALSVFSFLISCLVSLKSIFPNVQVSEKKNLMSFVDICHNFTSEESYVHAFGEEPSSNIVSEIASLNYNLSKALVKKNKAQAWAVSLIGVAIAFLFLALLIAFLG